MAFRRLKSDRFFTNDYSPEPQTQPESGYNGSNFAMSKPAFAPGGREVWYSDGGSGFYVLRVPAALWPDPTSLPSSTPVNRCPTPSGRLAGGHLGVIGLGQQRGQARQALSSSTRNHPSWDFFCLAGGGIRAGYPSARPLRTLGRGERRHVRNRIVLALTADRYYAPKGIRPGTPLRAPDGGCTHAGTSRSGASVPLGSLGGVWTHTWYVTRGRGSSGILKVRHGMVQEVGIAQRAPTRSRARAHRFMASFS